MDFMNVAISTTSIQSPTGKFEFGAVLKILNSVSMLLYAIDKPNYP